MEASSAATRARSGESGAKNRALDFWLFFGGAEKEVCKTSSFSSQRPSALTLRRDDLRCTMEASFLLGTIRIEALVPSLALLLHGREGGQRREEHSGF